VAIKQEPFVRYHEEKQADSFAIRLSKDGSERELLEKAKKILEQTRDSTAIKQLAWIGAEVILDKKISRLIDNVTNNRRKNKRLGIVDFD